MIYTFGDSITYGYNFEDNREQRIWPHYISKKLNQPYINYAAPGGSNWRIARKISSMHFSKEDIVIIPWTDSSRFEFGVNADYKSPEPRPNHVADYVEKENGLISRRFFNQLADRTSDNIIKNFNNIAYNELFNSLWFEQMFKVMFSSCYHILNKSNCKWVMFNTWCSQYSKLDEVYNTPNYFFKDSENLTNYIRKNDNVEYWNDTEHLLASEIILENIEVIYGNLLGN